MNDGPAAARASTEARVATVRDLVDAAAARCGSSTAFQFPDDACEETFAQLAALVRAGAGALAGLGVRPGDTVATALPNGPAAVHLFLAIMYAGAVVVPLNPDDGEKALGARLANAAPKLLFHDRCSDGAARAAPACTRCVAVEPGEATPWSSATDDAIASSPVMPGDEAAIFYTSGTTGGPKGVVMTHAGEVATARLHATAQQLGPQDSALLLLPLFHMNAQNVTLLPGLLLGTRTVVPRAFRAARVWDWIARYRCSWFAAVPAMLSELLAMPAPATRLVGLRFVRSSSAPLVAQTQDDFERRFGVPVVQCMGMTEAGATVFFNPLPPQRGRAGSVGRPLGFEVRLVDGQGVEVADGDTGHVEVRGDTVMKGYHGDERLTASVFRPGGWLRTGDVARRDEDGFYYVVGRSGERANKGGEKIDLGEVAAVLESHPGVGEAAAVSVPDPVLGEDIIAFVAPVAGRAPGERELRAHCERAFGAFMAPSRIHLLDKLPRGPLGKVRRDQLQERALAGRPVPARDRGAPFAHEDMLGALWCEALGVETVSPDDDFFAAGGTSLAAARFTFRVHEVFGQPLPVARLFEAPRFADLSAYLERSRGDSESAPSGEPVCLQPGDGRNPLFLVPGGGGDEEIIFFIYRGLLPFLGPERTVYALPAPAQDIEAHADVSAIAKTMRGQMEALPTSGARHLAGFCIGGLIAFEMAQQLRVAGEPPATLTLVDTAFPSARRRWINRLHRPRALAHAHGRLFGSVLWQRLAYHATHLRQAPRGERMAYLRGKIGMASRFYRHNTRREALTHPDAAAARDVGRRRRKYQRTLLRYRPAHWPGRLNLVVCDNPGERALPWRAAAGEAVILSTPGNHGTQVREFADAVAARLLEVIGPVR